jgi:hypothetical protein
MWPSSASQDNRVQTVDSILAADQSPGPNKVVGGSRN